MDAVFARTYAYAIHAQNAYFIGNGIWLIMNSSINPRNWPKGCRGAIPNGRASTAGNSECFPTNCGTCLRYGATPPPSFWNGFVVYLLELGLG